jgi:hypothetical protein
VRASRTAVIAVVVPVAAYVGVLLLVAGLHTHPPALGWIGLGVVAALGVGLAAGALVLFPRMRANVEAAAAADPGRLLVLADARCSGELLCATVAARLAGRDAEVLVVAPVLASPLHYLAGDEGAERQEAEARLAAVVTALRRRGLRAHGRVGDDDPLQAFGDALAAFPAGEALVVSAPESHWLEAGLFERARGLVPVLEHVETG